MRKLRFPIIILILADMGFLLYLFFSMGQLPDRVATHFGLGGQPDSWLSRTAYLIFMTVFQSFILLVSIGVGFLSPILPTNTINIPNREYWLAPERRNDTFTYIFRCSIWVGVMVVCFMIGIHLLIIHANSQPVVQLSLKWLFTLSGVFFSILIIYYTQMRKHFKSINVKKIVG